MTRRLYLLRHAKSSWDDSALADHDRPLAGRGRRAAAVMAEHLADQRIVPELVLCSTAVRTRQTFERLGLTAPVQFERRLYGANAGDLLDRLHAVPDEVGSVMLIGHNPGLEQLALRLSRPSPARSGLEAKFPTGALATLEIADTPWLELGPGCAVLTTYVRPRDLTR